jgi:hypothetical protein
MAKKGEFMIRSAEGKPGSEVMELPEMLIILPYTLLSHPYIEWVVRH